MTLALNYAREPRLFGRTDKKGNQTGHPRPWIFLAGPTPRDGTVERWRTQARIILEHHALNRNLGTILIPEDEDFDNFDPVTINNQVEWEWKGLEESDAILFWVPRNMVTLPGLTTNVEFGMQAKSNKVVLGYPEDAEHCGYLDRIARKERMLVTHDLQTACAYTVALAFIRCTASMR